MDTPNVVAALGALAQDARLRAFRLLVERGPEGLPAGQPATALGVPPSSLTFHLQQLLHAELVTQHRASRNLIYAPDVAAMNGLVAYLTENCCGQGVACSSVQPRCGAHRSLGGLRRSHLGMTVAYDLPRHLAAEALGTALLVARVVRSGAMAQSLTGDTALMLLGNTIATGAVLVVLITTLGPISGAHFNPAVSLVFALRRELPARETRLYAAAQLAGASPARPRRT